MTDTLHIDHIPIERHWGISMRLHNDLGHSEPWEICQEGCDSLAHNIILFLFDEPNTIFSKNPNNGDPK